MEPLTYFNRLDIVEAYYCWLTDHHIGIVPDGHPDYWRSYNRLSWIPSDLKYAPRSDLSLATLTENGKGIYFGLCARIGWECGCQGRRKHVA